MAFQPSPSILNSKSEPPALFDGTPRLYISVFSPFAQRVWIARNFKGLENVEIVEIDLRDKPSWYVDKVYPPGQVPSLEHNGKVLGESMDLLKYVEKNFDGPSIFPKGLEKEAATKELLEYTDELNKRAFTTIRSKEATTTMAQECLDPAFDHLEAALGKFNAEGPYFLGEISVVDFAYAPFVERFQLLLPDFVNYDPLQGRPKLKKWVEAMNTVDAYTSTKVDPNMLLSVMKKFVRR